MSLDDKPWGYCRWCARLEPVAEGVLTMHRNNDFKRADKTYCLGSLNPPDEQPGPDVDPDTLPLPPTFKQMQEKPRVVDDFFAQAEYD